MNDNREALISAIQRLPHNGTCLWQSGNDDCDCHKAEAMRLARLAPSPDEGLRRCSKCGSTNVYVRYDGFHGTDRLDCRCRECGWSWWDKPLDALAQEGETA